MLPETRYAKCGDVHVAYRVFGEGPINLVYTPGFVSHIENYWDDPSYARWLNGLARHCRVAMFDKRGTGLSDRVSHLPSMDERMEDLRVVMDAAGMDRAAVSGISEGGPLAMLFAASHPERCHSLILYGTFPRFSFWMSTDEAFDGPARAIRCALAIDQAVRPLGLEVRSGLHTGEVELSVSDVRGIAVHIASRVAGLARPGEAVVSRAVKDLVAGSGFAFEDFGIHQLKGVPDDWQLFRATG